MGSAGQQPKAESGSHITDHDLERYHLGMVEEAELAALEEHILGCPACAERAEQTAVWVDAIRSAVVISGADAQKLK